MKEYASVRYGLSGLVALLMAGCSINQPVNERYSVSKISTPDIGMGIVFGKRCEGGFFSVKNVKTGEETGYTGSYPDRDSVFAMQLPAGEYVIQQISTGAYRPMISNNPVRFMVSAGKTVYIGTLIKSWSIFNNSFLNKVPEKYKCDGEKQYVVYEAKYHIPPSAFWMGLKNDTTPDWASVYVSNYVKGVLPEIHTKFPDLDLSQFEVRLMK
ncbi:hypothetical protein BJG93_36175 [Paraburkholderia sprentiae WSM5005]|uniref:DUF2846 domain-containing protein n=1 Tax=Paraburkholderia sprentiae WSM5005 TaxID=754502 RepID=A0A8F4KIF2_9BURK|nr:hypothetical protein [Paraburkholderia sprentiae]QXE07258.1 hypothetical protein BJG93_36175 [Paraburkholderia sprentiae WSM5005]